MPKSVTFFGKIFVRKVVFDVLPKGVLEYPWYRNSAGATFVVATVVLFC